MDIFVHRFVSELWFFTNKGYLNSFYLFLFFAEFFESQMKHAYFIKYNNMEIFKENINNPPVQSFLVPLP